MPPTTYYITTANLNLREGAGMNYATSLVLEKGDTVQLLGNEDDYWLKVQHGKDSGYVAQSYLQPISLTQEVKEPDTNLQQSEVDYTSALIGWLFFFGFFAIIAVALFKAGQKYRSKTTVCLLAFFFGSFGLHKFYLGHTAKGIASLLSWWTLIPALVGLIDFIKIVTMNAAWYDFKYNNLAPPEEAFTLQNNLKEKFIRKPSPEPKRGMKHPGSVKSHKQ